MKISLKQVLSAYFSSPWKPSVLFVLLLCVFVAAIEYRSNGVLLNVLFVCLGITWIFVFVAGVWNLTQKRWLIGIKNVLMLPICAVIAFCALFSATFVSEDHFADDLTIPSDMEVATPLDELDGTSGGEHGGFQGDRVKNGDPSIQLRNSSQPGIYDAEIWVNPGEPGMLYLKAFEVTQGTPLSVNRLRERSNEWAGWSDKPDELFFSNTHFTIYEGDWGKPYAARFEVWFKPDSGAEERKLMEKVFKIEGWQM